MSQMRDRSPEKRQRRRRELGVVKSWMEVGGLPVLPEEEAQVLCEEHPFYLVWFSLSTHSITVLSFFSEPVSCDGSHFFFSQFGSTEDSECAEGGSTASRDGGLGRIEVAVAGSEAEGLYRLLRGTISHPPMSYASPLNTTTPQLPPSLNHPLSSLKLYLKLLLLWLKKLNWDQKSPPQLHHRSWGWLSLPTSHPFTYSWGVSRESISARWRVQ